MPRVQPRSFPVASTKMIGMARITLIVNGTTHQVDAGSDESVLSVLRNRLGMTGTKYGCGEGLCGACTVLLDGKPTRSCLLPASAVAGRKIETIEGLSNNGNGSLHPLQRAFLEEEAFQCGYCTPGMIMSALGLLNTNPAPTEPDIVEHMNGNICRCGAYPRIVAAIRRAGGKKQ